MRSIFAIVALVGSAVCASAADEKPKLNFAQDGDDLVVSTTIIANHSSHVLWTHSSGLGRDVYLKYHVFQNRDLLVRGQKPLEVKWRLAGRTKGEANYHVEKSFLPSSEELKDLLPQLQKLMEEGEKSRPKRKS
jgi:hypothetical protein